MADDATLTAIRDDVRFHRVESIVAGKLKVRDRLYVRRERAAKRRLPLFKGAAALNVENVELHAAPVGAFALDRGNQRVEGAAPHPEFAIQPDVGRKAGGEPCRRIQGATVAGQESSASPDRPHPVKLLRYPPSGNVGGDFGGEQGGGHAGALIPQTI